MLMVNRIVYTYPQLLLWVQKTLCMRQLKFLWIQL